MSVRDTEPLPPPSAAPEEGGFLRRWSQRKQAVARGETPPEPAPPAPPPAPAAREDEAPLPDPAGLTLTDDFRGFLRPKVPPELKRQALTQLFSQAHFNQVDGLDVYMDDYNLVPDLTVAEHGLLQHARAVLAPDGPAAEREASEAPARTVGPAEPVLREADNTADDATAKAAAAAAEPEAPGGGRPA